MQKPPVARPSISAGLTRGPGHNHGYRRKECDAVHTPNLPPEPLLFIQIGALFLSFRSDGTVLIGHGPWTECEWEWENCEQYRFGGGDNCACDRRINKMGRNSVGRPRMLITHDEAYFRDGPHATRILPY